MKLTSAKSSGPKPLVERLEQLSDLILTQPGTSWVAASLVMWEAAQALRALQHAREQIYVSSAASPDE